LQGKTTLARKAANGWQRPFDEPIPLPRGRRLVTLEDAGKYITKLPKAEHEAAEWQAAMEALILVATSGGPHDLEPPRRAPLGTTSGCSIRVAGSWRGINNRCCKRAFASVSLY